MTDRLTPRQLLAMADDAKRIADGADAARARIRLLRTPVVHRKSGLFGWARDRSKAPDPKTFEVLDRDIVVALYDALGVVESDSRQRARDLEARVSAEAAR